MSRTFYVIHELYHQAHGNNPNHYHPNIENHLSDLYNTKEQAKTSEKAEFTIIV